MKYQFGEQNPIGISASYEETFGGRHASIAETRGDCVDCAGCAGVCRQVAGGGRVGIWYGCTFVEHGDEDLRVGIAGSADRSVVVAGHGSGMSCAFMIDGPVTGLNPRTAWQRT